MLPFAPQFLGPIPLRRLGQFDPVDPADPFEPLEPLTPIRPIERPTFQDMQPTLPRYEPPAYQPSYSPPSASAAAAGAGVSTLFWILDTASMAASAYHGYKRNNSVGWAIWWGFMGALFPVITPVIALAQGFGKKAKKS